jgi:hypothetical protein
MPFISKISTRYIKIFPQTWGGGHPAIKVGVIIGSGTGIPLAE